MDGEELCLFRVVVVEFPGEDAVRHRVERCRGNGIMHCARVLHLRREEEEEEEEEGEVEGRRREDGKAALCAGGVRGEGVDGHAETEDSMGVAVSLGMAGTLGASEAASGVWRADGRIAFEAGVASSPPSCTFSLSVDSHGREGTYVALDRTEEGGDVGVAVACVWGS